MQDSRDDSTLLVSGGDAVLGFSVLVLMTAVVISHLHTTLPLGTHDDADQRTRLVKNNSAKPSYF